MFAHIYIYMYSVGSIIIIYMYLFIYTEMKYGESNNEFCLYGFENKSLLKLDRFWWFS